MNEKMNLNMFNEYKQKMKTLMSWAEEYSNQHEKDDNFDSQKFEQEVAKQYLELQEKLLSYDLSDIPFEAWQDLIINYGRGGDFGADFSKAKANIDYNNYDFIVDEHPDIFLSPEDLSKVPETIRDNFTKSFYARDLRFEDIRQYPELIDVLKNKNLNHLFAGYNTEMLNRLPSNYRKYVKVITEVDMINGIGQEKFLELCLRYGRYLEDIYNDLSLVIKDGKCFEKNSVDAKKTEIDYHSLTAIIENAIAKKCQLGKKHIII